MTFPPGAAEPLSPGQFASVRRILSRSPFYTNDDTALRVNMITNLAATVAEVNIRYSQPDGTLIPNRFTIGPITPFTLVSKDFPLSEGILHQLIAHFAGIPSPLNMTWVSVLLIQGTGATATVLGALVSGYITFNDVLFWPGTPAQHALDGNGTVQEIFNAAPIAGSDWFFAPPANVRVQIDTIETFLVTDASVGIRTVTFTMVGPLGPVFRASAGSVNPSSGAFFTGYAAAPANPPFIASFFTCTLPPICVLQGTGSSIQSLTVGLGAGDQWGDQIIRTRQWFVVP